MEDFYDLLEVPEDASTDEIDRAWREKVRAYHPDVNDDVRANAQFKTLKKAHEVLADETKRSAYDRMGHAAYVRKRLGGLPTSDLSDAVPDSAKDDATDRGRRRDRSANRTAGARQNRDGGRDRGRSRDAGSNASTASSNSFSQRSAGGTSQSTSRSSQRSSTGTSRSTNGTSRSTATDASRTSTTGRSRSSTAESRSQSTAEGDSRERRSRNADAPGRRRSPLWYGWIGVLVAGAIYLGGLAEYLRANAEALSSLLEAVAADPVTALTATYGLASPVAHVLTTATVDAPLSLLFPAGAAALALVFVAVVASFGRGTAYLYLLGGAAPLIGMGIGTAAALPDGVVLALVAVLPLGATLVFLVDVGRVLLDSR